MVRRRELTRHLSGVYLDHTGPPSWSQRAWIAVLYAAPAALCGTSALDSPPPDGPIHVAIDASRRLANLEGIRFHRRRGLDSLVRWNASPPRLCTEVAVLDLVDEAEDELSVVRLLTDAVGGRRTTAERVRRCLRGRARLRRRGWVLRLLDDIEAGAGSVLEHAYLTRVERPHGLPRGDRQRRRAGARGAEYRDVEYDVGLVVELDGRTAHDSFEAGGRDAGRDLDDQADGRRVVRLRWRQVYGDPCRTAARIATILQGLGWSGPPRRCGADCQLP